MRYDDASQTGSMTADSVPTARADVDSLPAGSAGPATGNAITGIGTTTGLSGADSTGAAPAAIVAVEGAGGPTTGAGGSFQAAGQYGLLNLSAQGDYSYARNPGTPDGVQDVFRYTLADNTGATSSTTLTFTIGQTATAAALDGVLNLPAGVELSDIRVSGRDLIIKMPDGSEMVIPGGAVFVPQLVIGDVQVPPANLAALLIDSEPQPAAGPLQSSGGNFAGDVPPLDPGVPLGDLIPPTEFGYEPPIFEEVGGFIDDEPEAGVTSAFLDDDEQAGGNAGGVGDDAGGAIATGFLPGEDGDGDLTWALLTTGAPNGFTYSAGPNGSVLVFQNGNPNAVLSITVNPATGGYTVNQLGPISHPVGGDENNVIFPISYAVTDEDGDTDTGTLNIDVDDDTPIARNDTDALVGKALTTDGNVITAVGTTSAPGSADSPGADGLGSSASATDGLNGIRAGTSGAFTDVGGSTVTINGQFGSLAINADGSYVYTRFENARQGGTDVFTYRIIDGDGDTATATLTITVPTDPVPVPVAANALVDDDGLPDGNKDSAPGDDIQNPDPDSNESTFSGVLTANFGGDVPGTFNFSAMNLLGNSTAVIGQETVVFSWDDATDTLTARIIESPDGTRIEDVLFDIHLSPDGSYDLTLRLNVLHTDETASQENNETATIIFTAVDSNGDATNGNLTITFDDDIPVALPPIPPEGEGDPTPRVHGLVDEDDLPLGNNDDALGDDDPIDNSGDGDATTTGDGPGSLAALFAAGADQPLTYSLSTTTTGLPTLFSNNVQLVYTVEVDDVTGVSTLTAKAGATTIFTLTVEEDGSWLFNLEGQLDHSVPGFEDNIDIDFSSILIGTDSDGDDVTAAAGAFVVTVDDDLPTAKPPQFPNEGQVPAPLITGTVDEDQLPTGNQDLPDQSPGDDNSGDADGDGDETTVGGGHASLATLFNAGADQPLTILLSVNTAKLDLLGLKSQGATVQYDVNVETGVLTGYVNSNGTAGFQAGDGGDRVVFTLTVAPDGTWEFDLVDQLDHAAPAPGAPGFENDLFIDFSSVVTAEDSDGDPVTAADGTFVIKVDDDMPAPFGEICPDDVEISNVAGGVDTGNLNLPPVGADEPGVASFGVETGDPVVDQVTKLQLSSDGVPLVYVVVSATVLEGREGIDGAPVFRITLNGDGTYTYQQIEDISSTTTLTITDLDSVGGGNVEAKAIDVENSEFDLILSTQPGKTVNTNSTEIGVGGGQSLVDGDHIRIDLVKDAFVTGGGDPILNFGEYYTATAFRQDISGLSGPQTANFIVRAIVVNESGAAGPADGDNVFYGDGNDSFVLTGTTLNIYAPGSDTPMTALELAAAGITVTQLADGWQVTGIPADGEPQADYSFEIVSTTPFNAVQVEANNGSDTFKLGFIEITSTIQTDVSFSVPIVYTDYDGDPVVCDIDVNLGAPTNTPNVTILVDEAALDTVGSNPGSDAETEGGDLAALITGGSGSFTFALVSPGATPYGTLTLLPNGQYSFTLTQPYDTTPDNDNGPHIQQDILTFTYEVTDTVTGLKSQGTITVDIKDDVPSAASDTDTVDLLTSAASGNVLTGVVAGSVADDANSTDGVADTIGADQPGSVVAVTYGGSTVVVPADGFATVGDANGTLKIYANGDYIYTRAPGSPGNAEYTFTYTIQDGDGDQAQATLEITINDSGVTINGLDGEGAEETVFENDLANGTSPNAGNLTQTGTFTFTSPDGAATISIGGTSFTYAQLAAATPGAPLVIDSPLGVLNITGFSGTTAGGTVSYSYTLQVPFANGAASNSTTENFTVIVTDTDGSTDDASLDITIVDDAPIANLDTNSLNEDTPSVGGNVLTNDVSGADGGKTVTTPGTYVGTYGTLQLGADGSYTYTIHTDAATQALVQGLSAGQTLVEPAFPYTMRDGDQDTSSSTLTITITGVNDGVTINGLDGEGAEETVFENDLANGTSPNAGNLTQTGTFTFTSPDGAASISIGGTSFTLAQLQAATPGAPLVIDSPLGVLNITGFSGTAAGGTVSYSYTLQVPFANGAASNSTTENFQVIVTDEDGSTDDASLDITIVDDAPIAVDDTDTVTEGLGNVADGNVLTGSGGSDSNGSDGSADTAGADGGKTVIGARAGTEAGPAIPTNNVTPAGVTISGTYGDLLIKADGSYTYTIKVASIPGGVTGETFAYAMRDGDGDIDYAQININFAQDARVPDVTGSTATVYEDGLADGVQHGANSEIANGTFTVQANGENYTLTLDGDAGAPVVITMVGQTVTTSKGVLEITSISAPVGGVVTYGYKYTLSDNLTHTGQGEINPITDTITMTVTDATGDTDLSPGSIVVSIVDDIPVLGPIQNQTTDNNPTDNSVTFKDATGSLHFTAGADGAGSAMTITASTTATSGGKSLVYNQVGNVLTAYQNADNLGTTYNAVTDTVVVFTLTVNPAAGPSGQYVFDLVTPLDPTVTPVPIGSGSAFGQGPTGYVVVDNPGVPNIVYATGWTPAGGFTPAEETAWLNGGEPAMTQSATVNGSTAGWGLGNNNLNAGEMIRFDFGGLDDYDDVTAPDGSYEQPAGVGPMQNATYANLSFEKFDSGDVVQVVAHYTNGTSQSWTFSDGSPATHTVNAPAGADIAWIDVYEKAGQIKLNLTEVGVRSSSINKDINFTLQLTDGDGDTTGAPVGFTVNVSNSGVPAAPDPTAGGDTNFAATSSLLSYDNDNVEQQKVANSITNTIWMGALAAAGVESEPLHAITNMNRGSDEAADETSSASAATGSVDAPAPEAVESTGLTGSSEPAQAEAVDAAPVSSGEPAGDQQLSDEVAAADEASAPSEGTDAPAPDTAPAVAASDDIAMPSAEQLLAIAAANENGGEQHNAIVGKALVDALSDTSGPDLDTLVNAVTQPATGEHANVLPIATPLPAYVPEGDMGAFAGFANSNGALLDQLTVHQDAAPAHG